MIGLRVLIVFVLILNACTVKVVEADHSNENVMFLLD